MAAPRLIYDSDTDSDQDQDQEGSETHSILSCNLSDLTPHTFTNTLSTPLTPIELLTATFPLSHAMCAKMLQCANVQQVTEYIVNTMSTENILSLFKIKTVTSVEKQLISRITEEEPQKLCRHYLTEGCYRRDCWFSHDTRSVSCAYWQKPQGCSNAECLFLHDITDKIRHDLLQISGCQQEPEVFSEDEEVVKQQELPRVDSFPTLSSTSPKTSVKPNLDFSKAAKSIPKEVPKQSDKPVPKRSKSTSPHRNQVINPIPWVESGGTVAAMYKKYREEAIEHAQLRNRCFQASTEAYIRGDGKAAKDLSRQGRWHNERMSELHAAAAENIFALRNSNIAGLPFGVMDLHGLHVKEALSIVERSIKRKSDQPIYLITGTGHHASEDAKIMPAIKAMLTQRGLYFSDCSTDQRGGMIMVDLN